MTSALLPIPERIAQEITERLEEIQIVNSFDFDVVDVIRPDRLARNWTPKNYRILLVQGTEDRLPELDHEGNPPAICWQVEYQIKMFLRDLDKSETAHAVSEDRAAANIRKAITNKSDWYTMNDVALFSEFGSTEPFLSNEGDHQGISIPLTVTYRASETDPFEVRR
jgi:hypothetical protein